MNVRDALRVKIRRLFNDLVGLHDKVTVTGGAAPALYDTNAATAPVRPTVDVDLIVTTRNLSEWYQFVGVLQERGFSYPSGEPICRYAKGDLVVDVMPTDSAQLGFSNRWYRAAAAARIPAVGFDATAGVYVVSPLYFIATKLDAYRSRGASDPYSSHDLEDIFAVMRGIPSVLDEIAVGTDEVHDAIRAELADIVARKDVLDLIRSHLEGDAGTQALAPRLLANLRNIL